MTGTDGFETSLPPPATPTRRAGLRLPEKRTNTDLDRSAKRRAVRLLYATLVHGDEEGEEAAIAKQILDADLDAHVSSLEESSYGEELDDEDDEFKPAARSRGSPVRRGALARVQLEAHARPAARSRPGTSPSPSPRKFGSPRQSLAIAGPPFEDLVRVAGFVPTQLEGDDVEAPASTVLESGRRKFDDRALFVDLSEGYFEQSKAHDKKISDNTLSMVQADQLLVQELTRYVKLGRLMHLRERQALEHEYVELFPQYAFELQQGFSLQLYGVGSKRGLVTRFVEWVRDQPYLRGLPVLVVNGYNKATRYRDVWKALLPVLQPLVAGEVPRAMHEGTRVVAQHLRSVQPPPAPVVMVVVHNIDGELFRDDMVQQLMAHLALLPHVWLVLTTDHLNAPVLWDMEKLALFRFAWHDVSTFEPYMAETLVGDVLASSKSNKFVGSKGAHYVLLLLTDNARRLYQVLLGFQLGAMEKGALAKGGATKVAASLRGTVRHGVLLKTLYLRCVEEFIANNELNFRTMLTEFVEHKMCRLVKDKGGEEIVFVPFNYDEMMKLREQPAVQQEQPAE